MSDGKTLYKVLSQETKKTAAGKSYVNAKIVDQFGQECYVSDFKHEHWNTPFVKGIIEIKGKYKNLMNVDETTDQFGQIQTSTTAAPVQAPKSDDEKLEKDYYEQILKSGAISEDALEEALTVNMNDGVNPLAALKIIARGLKVELKAPETKEEKMERMAKTRDEIAQKQIDMMREMTTEMKELRASINQLKETLFQFVGAIQVPQQEAKK
jgi:hypothetical protein